MFILQCFHQYVHSQQLKDIVIHFFLLFEVVVGIQSVYRDFWYNSCNYKNTAALVSCPHPTGVLQVLHKRQPDIISLNSVIA